MKIFELFGSIMIENDGANESLDKTESKASKVAGALGNGIATAAKWGVAIVGAAAAAGGAIFAAGTKFAESTDRIDKMSQTLGLSRDGFQEWDFVLSQAGVSIDSMQNGMKTMSQRMNDVVEGTGAGIEIFDKLGIAVTDANGNVRSQEDVFNDSMLALQGMEDGIEKAALAQELFGRNGQDLLPLLNQEAGSIDELKAKAQELGLVLGDESIDAGVKFTDTMDELKRSVSAMGANLMSGLMPTIQNFLDLIMDNMPMIQDILEDVFKAFGSAIDEVLPLLFDIIQDVLPMLMELLSTLMTTIFPVLMDLFSVFITSILPVLLELFDIFVTVLLPPLLEILDIVVTSILPPLIDLFLLLVSTVLPPLVEIFQIIVATVLPPFIELLVFVIDNILPIIIDLIVMFVEVVLPPLMELINVLVTTILPPLVDIFMLMAEDTLPILMDVFESLLPVIEFIMYAVADVINLVIAIITGDWEGAWDAIKSYFSNVIDGIMVIVDTFAGLFGTAFQAIADVVSGIWNGIVDGIKGGINFIIEGINSFIEGINSLEIPDWVPVVGGLSMNIPTITPLLADGGVITKSGRAIVGEAGPELLNLPEGASVIPLDRVSEFESKNRGGDVNQTVNIYSPTQLSPSEVAKQTRRASRKLALEMA